jgi:hypothetical protein
MERDNWHDSGFNAVIQRRQSRKYFTLALRIQRCDIETFKQEVVYALEAERRVPQTDPGTTNGADVLPLLACCLTYPHRAIAPDPHWQGRAGGRSSLVYAPWTGSKPKATGAILDPVCFHCPRAQKKGELGFPTHKKCALLRFPRLFPRPELGVVDMAVLSSRVGARCYGARGRWWNMTEGPECALVCAGGPWAVVSPLLPTYVFCYCAS